MPGTAGRDYPSSSVITSGTAACEIAATAPTAAWTFRSAVSLNGHGCGVETGGVEYARQARAGSVQPDADGFLRAAEDGGDRHLVEPFPGSQAQEFDRCRDVWATADTSVKSGPVAAVSSSRSSRCRGAVWRRRVASFDQYLVRTRRAARRTTGAAPGAVKAADVMPNFAVTRLGTGRRGD